MRQIPIVLCCLCVSGSAWAQGSEHPDEADLFGGPPATAPTTTPTTTDRDAAELANTHPERDAFATGEATDNPLQVGGIYYHRFIMSAQRGVSADYTPLTMPLQFDGFLDVRPNDRVRGFLDVRLVYDPTRDAYSNPTRGSNLGTLQTASTSAAPTGVSLNSTVQAPNNPSTVLNEAWLKFDIERTIFVTAGKQHVKWGASRYWNPTDFLNTQKRDPLLPYDLRLGNTMIKVEVPLEASQTNFYAIALFDNPLGASTLGQLGGAVRAETVLANAAVGIDGIVREGRAPTVGLDVSSPLGPLDVYAEASCVLGTSVPQLVLDADPLRGGNVADLFHTHVQRRAVQVSGGANYAFGWRENRQAIVGAEYFYNQLGYADAHVYPLLILEGQYLPFYTGRHYAAVYLTAEGPDNEKHTNFTLSTVGNLSDGSFVSRVDFSWRALTYLTFEAYVDGHYGTEGGEFNFTLRTPSGVPLIFNGQAVPAIYVPPTLYDVGVALRLSF